MSLPPQVVNMLMCVTHGGLRHVFVHEAGHAVMSIDLGIECPALVIHDVDRWMAAAGSKVELGGLVLPHPDPTRWVPDNPLAALKLVWAGVLAERAVLGHAVDLTTSSKGDVDVWLKGMNEPDGFDPAKLPELVGYTLPDLLAEITAWASTNTERIDQLAQALRPSSELDRATFIQIAGEA